ncbi:MAG: tRNA lysidine(34) synthetase TilS [Agriterribacter sp.]
MQDLITDFKHYVEKEKLFQTGDTLLVAVSGGVDSVVLCELCSLLQYNFIIAHCNFGLRGEESDDDETFVKNLTSRYKANYQVKKFDTEAYAQEQKISIQVAARTLRYEWFYQLLEQLPVDRSRHAAYLVTAHHADDNIETVLMNFVKGTGIAGMRGMLPKTGALVRPLLFAHKIELLNFAKDHQLAYREDSSNASDKYSRNYIRHQVIPLLQKIYAEADQNMVANIDRFREVELLYNEALVMHKKKLLEYRNNEVYIPVLKLLKTVPLKTILFEIMKEFGFTAKQSDEVIALLQSESGKFVLSSTHRILKNRNWLIISPLIKNNTSIIVIEKDMDRVVFEEGRLSFKTMNVQPGEANAGISKLKTVAAFDGKEISYPLLLRKWKAGDYFYPLGMTKKKKLARFFIDQKFSLADKEKVWVLEMNKKIIWVINHRIDDRFKIKATTKEIIQVTFNTD